MERVIIRELELGVRNPGCVRDWICGGRRGVKSTDRLLEIWEMYIYFKDCRIAKSRKLSGILERHCVSLDFSGDLGKSDGGGFQEKFANYVRATGEH